ncbi:MAG: fused MFS/spermidine synthase [Desulfomonile tiedjei]|nr:fused MFS/spermidine synthase [Desulfomonile tiedjei]
MMSWMFFLFGLCSMTGQISLLREILVIFHGTEISIGIFFGAWLSGIGIGALAGAWLVKKREGSFLEIFLYSLSGLGFSLILQIVVVRSLPYLSGASPAELIPLHGILVAVPIGTFLTAFLTGFLFPLGCKALERTDDRVIARLYVFEGLGSLLGGLMFTFVLVRYLSPLAIVSAVNVPLAIGAAVYGQSRKLKGCVLTAAVLLVTSAIVLSSAGRLVTDASLRIRWDALHPGLKLLASEPTPYQQVEISRLGKQFSLFGNGKIVSSFPDAPTADRLAALILAQKPDTRRVLVIGGGIGSFLVSLLSYPVDWVDVIEPDPEALEVAKRFMPSREREALGDPRVHMIFGDGRFYVNQCRPQVYDAVICTVPDPVSAFWNRYYTLEFFQAAARALRPGGMFFTRVTSADNFWGSDVASYAGSVYHTMKQVFPAVLGTPGDETLFFASLSGDFLSLDPGTLKSRYRTLGKTFFDPEAFDTILPPARTAFVKGELERAPPLINTDFSPVSSSLAMILWGRFSGTEGMEVLNTLRRGGLTVYLIPMICFLAARIGFRARWGPREGADARFRVLLAMTAVGAAAMGMQIVLIYGYQSLFGYVFERIGLVAGAFMAGLAAGGWCIGLLLPRIRRKERALLVSLALFAGYCLILTTVLESVARREPWDIELIVSALVCVSGIFTGSAFPLVAACHLERARDAGESSGLTDATDHFGAALGAFITGALLVPLLGMERACIVMALILLIPAILFVVETVLDRCEQTLSRYRPSARVSFPYVRLTWLLIFSVAAAAAWSLLIGPPSREPVVKFPDDLLARISGSDRFAFHEGPYPHYVGTSPTQGGFTVTLSTIPPAGDVRGYGGPINLVVSVSERGEIKGLDLVESRETPSYLKGIDEWLHHFRGRSILEPLDDRIDSLSGATITARAVTESLNKTGQRIASPLLGITEQKPRTEKRPVWSMAIRDPRLLAVAALLVFFVFAFHTRSSSTRTVCLALSLLVLGVYLNAPFSCLDAAGIVKGQIPAAGTVWRNLLFVGVLAISVLWGQGFCGYLCPFGALQEFLAIGSVRRRASAQVERVGRYTKFVLLGVLMCLFLVTDDAIWFSFSPLQHFFGWKMDFWVLALAAACLFASTVYFRFWCRYLCPAGAFLALFNKVSLLKKVAPRPIPSRCDLGVAFPEDVDCIKCHRCLFQGSKQPRTPPGSVEP